MVSVVASTARKIGPEAYLARRVPVAGPIEQSPEALSQDSFPPFPPPPTPSPTPSSPLNASSRLLSSRLNPMC